MPEFAAAVGVTEKQIANGDAALSFTIVHDRFAETLTSSEVDSLLRLLSQAGAVDVNRAYSAMRLFDEVRAMTWRLLHPRP